MRKISVIFGLLFALQSYSEQKNIQLNANFDDNKIIQKVEESIQNLKFRSKILQISPSGERQSGTCSIYRKRGYAKMAVGKILVIVKDGKVTQYDLDLKEKTESTYNSSPLAFLLDRKLKLSGNVVILSHRQDDNDVRVRFARSNPDTEGSVTLIFSKDFVLKGWIIYSTNNAHYGTEIRLVNPKFNVKIEEQ